MATSGDRYLATSGDFPMARDNRSRHSPLACMFCEARTYHSRQYNSRVCIWNEQRTAPDHDHLVRKNWRSGNNIGAIRAQQSVHRLRVGMGHRRGTGVHDTHDMQQSLHRRAQALLGLYFVEVTRHVCVTGF